MARVAVVHNTLDLRGGADAVCMHVCEALAADHDVTLFTLSRSPLAALNDYFGTDAEAAVARPPIAPAVSGLLDGLPARLGPQLALRSVLLSRYVGRHADRFDAAVSTANEFPLPVPSVQYVHFPQFNLSHTDAGEAGRLNGLWSRLAGLGDRSLPADATLLANSGWTADVVAGIYGRRPAVCFPPVDPVPDPLPWGERESGVVVLGRLAPDKRPHRAVDVVDDLRQRGYDLHLHLVGSAPPAYRSYVRRIERLAADRSHVHLDCDASRDRVEELLRRHRYGLNTKPREHFGMAVAEYVAAGMVAFAPDSGGQREVLGCRADRLFDDADDAVATIAAAVDDGAYPEQPRDRFGSGRFGREVRATVADRLDGTPR
ncbi:MAG: glycosyltransferase family 4 protein [Salinirussus sp.]